MIAKAREKASNTLEASVEDIEYRDGWLTVVGTDRRIGLFEIARKESGARLSVDSEGEVDGPSWPNGTHICEVEIDPETGVTRVVRYTTVDDVGVAVNPMLVAGQVHGGVAQGIGQALYEGVSYDAEGQLLTASYQDYCLPRADDIPPIEVTLDGSAPCRTNPLGAKGCGESGAIGGPPCIANGVMDALSELGIRTLHTPLTPPKSGRRSGKRGRRGLTMQPSFRDGAPARNPDVRDFRVIAASHRPGMTVRKFAAYLPLLLLPCQKHHGRIRCADYGPCWRRWRR